MQARLWQPWTANTRDLFDVRDLLANEGIDDQMRNAFIVYLLSHIYPARRAAF
jgi:hypothetical protein